ncbi:HNH endonuclease signature motif containing protein [Nocardioides currus]|uniref:HNH nuclease domain-containing protein n=1 Tax=Nocardioides currus TaxID=2133958 RepID=A0A2R7Z041_9ACTN|nr:HNH endonuclease signature motif containing protein [Nocardioides currus]PUA81993.1 hypothetical protein C7S10_08115 [Nocardioides currus]
MPDQRAADLAAAADSRHVTFTTDQVSFDGTMHLEADLTIPDALGLAEAVTHGAARLAALGSTDTLDGRRATALGDLARHQLALGYDTDPAPTTPVPATTQIVLHAHLPAHAITDAITDAITGHPASGLTGFVEQAGGRVLTAEQVRIWCGRPDVQITVRPVLDLHQRLETTGYTPTPTMREHVIARDRTCVFPWCGRNARGCDLDHVIPYDHDVGPDQAQRGPTATDNLAALCRRHHRLKTHGRWRYEVTAPGAFVWTSPHGHQYLRDHTGSRPIAASGHPPDQ